MFKKLSLKQKLLTFPIIFFVLILLGSGVYSYFNNISNVRSKAASDSDKLVSSLLDSRIVVYQFLNTPNNSNQDKVNLYFNNLKNSILEFKNGLSVEENRKLCDVMISNIQNYLNDFNNKLAPLKIKDFNDGIYKNSDEIVNIINTMIPYAKDLENKLKDINKSAKELKDEAQNTLDLILIILAVCSLILFIIIYIILSKAIINSVENVHQGLSSFFSYLRGEKSTTQTIEVVTHDEIGEMIIEINKGIQTVKDIKDDKKVLEEIDNIIEKVGNGFYWYTIKGSSKDPLIEDLKTKLNKMIVETNEKMEIVVEALMAYGESNFKYEIKQSNNLNGIFGSIVSSTKLIGNNVSEILSMILNTGEKLNHDTTVLSSSSTQLSNAANEQASSLEETAAALEEITATIQNNTSNVSQMLSLANSLTSSAKDGLNLASETKVSMDEISSQVSAINEAIAVIDQIAFQTNILSLNAAVEAATAGEAGKGFAVVAGEVRNLASRSAEAAKEIKELVENATNKANSGKKVSDNMIEGYNNLNNKINETITIIEEVSNASKEQEAGISQINDAVASLDQTTQQNAMTASQISDLSSEVAQLAHSLVTAAKRAQYKEQTKSQVCDVDLVFTTSKLKNDHIKFKQNNYKKLGSNQIWTVTNCNDCNLGKWIVEQENNNSMFTKTSNWNELKIAHEKVHKSVQDYINADSKKSSNEILKNISLEIETATLKVFDTLNTVKVDNCNYLNNKR